MKTQEASGFFSPGDDSQLPQAGLFVCSIIQCNVKSLTARGGMIPNKSLAEHPNIIGADLC